MADFGDIKPVLRIVEGDLMKKQSVIFINTNDRIREQQGQKIVEGGLSRNSAWEKYLFNNEECRVVNVRKGKGHFFEILKIFLLEKNRTIISLYPSIGIQLYKGGHARDLVRKIYFCAVRFSAGRNRIVFDISDLKYEQAIDLELGKFDLKLLEKNEKQLFGVGGHYIFASNSMRDYVCNKYGIKKEKTDVCINGGSYPITYSGSIPVKFEKGKIYYVYAGTLNRGRNIEKMIDNFPQNDQSCLIIMGNEGEWLKEYIKQKNIYYLGRIEEEKAHYIASKCDVGLIPYDETRLYYNIAYPTKLSFYITAGIPFLSTPVKEVMRVTMEQDTGWCAGLEAWPDIMKQTDERQIQRKKENVKKIYRQYTWDSVLKNKFLNRGGQE